MPTPLTNISHSKIGHWNRIRVFLAVQGHNVVKGHFRQVDNADPGLLRHAVKELVHFLLGFDT